MTPRRPSLLATSHAYQRWLIRAPRIIRSRASFRAALHTARFLGYNQHGDAVYAALAMALVVRDGRVVTCWPLARLRQSALASRLPP